MMYAPLLTIEEHQTVTDFMSRKEAARFLGLTAQTLAQWACKKINLSYLKVGGKVMYRRTDLNAYLAANLHLNVSA